MWLSDRSNQSCTPANTGDWQAGSCNYVEISFNETIGGL